MHVDTPEDEGTIDCTEHPDGSWDVVVRDRNGRRNAVFTSDTRDPMRVLHAGLAAVYA